MKNDTYYFVTKLTAKENRKAILRALWQVPLFMGAMYGGMYGFFYFLLWVWKL